MQIFFCQVSSRITETLSMGLRNEQLNLDVDCRLCDYVHIEHVDIYTSIKTSKKSQNNIIGLVIQPVQCLKTHTATPKKCTSSNLRSSRCFSWQQLLLTVISVTIHHHVTTLLYYWAKTSTSTWLCNVTWFIISSYTPVICRYLLYSPRWFSRSNSNILLLFFLHLWHITSLSQ